MGNSGTLPILAYHHIGTAPADAIYPASYIPLRLFERQMRLLHHLGIAGVSLWEGVQRLQRGDCARCAALTFDDGYSDTLEQALPVLQRFGFRATCFFVTGCLGRYNLWDVDAVRVRTPLMDADGIRQWLEAGMEAASHTRTHPHLLQLSAAEAGEEIAASRNELMQITQRSVDCFCYPYGECSAALIELVRRAGFRAAVTTRAARASAADDLCALPRITVWPTRRLVRFALGLAMSVGEQAWRPQAREA